MEELFSTVCCETEGSFENSDGVTGNEVFRLVSLTGRATTHSLLFNLILFSGSCAALALASVNAGHISGLFGVVSQLQLSRYIRRSF